MGKHLRHGRSTRGIRKSLVSLIYHFLNKLFSGLFSYASKANHRLPLCPVVEPRSLRAPVWDAPAGLSEIPLSSLAEVLIIPPNKPLIFINGIRPSHSELIITEKKNKCCYHLPLSEASYCFYPRLALTDSSWVIWISFNSFLLANTTLVRKQDSKKIISQKKKLPSKETSMDPACLKCFIILPSNTCRVNSLRKRR